MTAASTMIQRGGGNVFFSSSTLRLSSWPRKGFAPTTTTTTKGFYSSFHHQEGALDTPTTTATTRQHHNQPQQQHQVRSHYTYQGPGAYRDATASRQALLDLWKGRDFFHRGFTVGIGGPVGSGKTATVHALCRVLFQDAADDNLAVVTNDIFTQEDAEFLTRQGVLPSHKIRAVETGGCPHAAIREDVSANLTALEELTLQLLREQEAESVQKEDKTEEASPFELQPPLLLCESGGDNLAANFSRELADLTLYVIDVAGGDKVPRKGGPGITQSDLLVINKVDLAEAVGADLTVMQDDARRMRGLTSNDEDEQQAPIVLAAVKHGRGLDQIRDFILQNYRQALAVSAEHRREQAAV